MPLRKSLFLSAIIFLSSACSPSVEADDRLVFRCAGVASEDFFGQEMPFVQSIVISNGHVVATGAMDTFVLTRSGDQIERSRSIDLQDTCVGSVPQDGSPAVACLENGQFELWIEDSLMDARDRFSLNVDTLLYEYVDWQAGGGLFRSSGICEQVEQP